VLPAVLYMLGDRVNALAPKRLRRAAERDSRPAEHGAWYRLSRFVMRRPGRIAAATATVLIVMGIPFLGIKFTDVDASVLPRDHSARVVDDAIKKEFPSDVTSPIGVVVARRDAAEFARRARSLDNVKAIVPPRELDGTTSVVDVISAAPPLSGDTKQLVRDLRDVPVDSGVRGQAASFIDLQESLRSHMPIALAIVVLATLVVLFLMTGSLILPLKSLLMNVLTLSAAFGLLVLIFQDGRFEGFLDYTSQGALEQTQPILLFAVAFGLSTDYGVFLLSRIKEARDNGVPDSEAVAVGLERTGRIVTAAALLFTVAIGAFATSQIIFIKEVGLGTALAVLIDATLIRALLVPALMELLGKWNWWAPKPMALLHRRIGLKEA
jgi:RND superfamily putative drug exporter